MTELMLLNCVYCNSPARMSSETFNDGSARYWAGCMSHMCAGRRENETCCCDTQEEAAAIWNERARYSALDTEGNVVAVSAGFMLYDNLNDCWYRVNSEWKLEPVMWDNLIELRARKKIISQLKGRAFSLLAKQMEGNR